MPIAALMKIVAAVVRPTTRWRVWRIAPAPMKPIPVTTPAATRSASPGCPHTSHIPPERQGARGEQRRGRTHHEMRAQAGRLVEGLALRADHEAEPRRRQDPEAEPG